MIPYALLRGIDPTVRDLFQRIRQGSIVAHTSVLTLDELTYRLLLALVKDRYGQAPLDVLRKDERAAMAEFYPLLLPRIAEFATLPNLVIEAISFEDWAAAARLMAEYGLRPRDAMHLATMRRIGCRDLASNDAHFDQVPGIRRFSTT